MQSSSAKDNLISDIHFLFALRYIPKDHGLEFSPHGIPKGLEPGNKCSIALSGGIDSEFLLKALTRRIVDEYSVDFEALCCDFVDTRGEPESVQAAIIAENYDIKFKRILIDDPLKDLKKLIEIVEEPRYNLYPYYLYKESRRFLWTGDGADEACCGYTFRYKKYLDNLGKCRNWQDRVKLYLTGHENDWVPNMEDMFVQKYKFSWDLILNYFKEFFHSDIGLPNVLIADINGKLRHDYLPVGFKLGKAAGINLITPYLDKEVFTSLVKAPLEVKYDYATNTGKVLLRRRLNRMDNHKRGFGFDVVGYYLRKGYDLVHSKINKDSLCFEIINRDWFLKHSSDVETRYVNKYLQIYALELYLETLLEKNNEMKIPLTNN